MKKLMILGSLYEFVALTKMAKARGCETVVCDGYPNGPAKAIADHVLDVDVRDSETIAAYCRRERVDGIITSFSDLLFECMVKIADLAGLPCYMEPAQLPYYRDKAVMKALLNDLGIPTPRHVCLEEGYADADLAAIRFPVVTKPIDMYGSRGLYVLQDAAEVRDYFEKACQSSKQKRILVEEYNTGHEFNLMSWVLDGQVHILGIADREKTTTGTKDVPISTRNVYPSRLINQVYGPAKAILERYIAATGQRSGALSMQFFWAPGQEVEVCEIAGRLLGYEHELIEFSSGLSIEKLLLDYVFEPETLAETLAAHSAFMERCSAVLYFQGKPGVIADQQAAKDIAAWPEVHTSQLFYQEGEALAEHGPQPYVARYYVTGESREVIDEVTERAFAAMSVKDASGRELLYQNEMPAYPV